MALRLGLLINPLAGLGGAVGLKGSDGAEVVARARELGATPQAGARALRTLKRIAEQAGTAGWQVFTVAGDMGAEACAEAGVCAHTVYSAAVQPSALDTREGCDALLAHGIDLLLFAGGDGTARDVAGVVGRRVPILGIPCGVKMYSGVFALSPEQAAEALLRWNPVAACQREAELLDIDESASRADRVSTRLYGYAQVPATPSGLQSAKVGSKPGDQAVEAAIVGFAASLQADHLYILGPGRTVAALAAELEGEPTLLGVDAYLGRQLLCRDANAAQLLALAEQYPTHLVMSFTGGQGCLFGRGNQPISAALLATVPRERLHVFAGLNKVAGLVNGQLFVDSGDPEVDRKMVGFIPVITSLGRTAMVRVVA